MDNRNRTLQGGATTSPESALASAVFEQFVAAGTFKSVLSTYRQLCEVLRLKPTTITNFYPRLKAKIHSWKAVSLWAKLDKRASHKCYNRGKACPNTRVLIIGAGPCGLRAAIEAQLLGAKVVIVEKRDRFSRNNVLHLWPFVIHDLRSLGAKKFFGKFCAGTIDHISIRQLQIILLKVSLLLGVEVHENVGFVSLKEPPEDQAQEKIGWRAFINPSDHPVSQYEFDVLIGADGKRNTLLGFNRKEFRGKLAIAITINFINRHTLEEAGVEEISGVAFIFNQKFFQDMREQTGIDLENIVYYKDDTHYFVMTAKKQSLLERGVIINDYNDTARLLSAENVDREALMEYARDAAIFATDFQLPSLDFAVNHYGQADVAMFDFTSMYAAENACRITERRGHKLLQGLVGDSLLEPFWPTGSGCARGFLSSLDVAWLIRSWASGKMSQLQVLAEREAIYRLLAQTTPENLNKDFNQYTLNPSSRYPNLNLHSVLPSQVRSLYNTDGKLDDNIADLPLEIPKKKRRKESIAIHPDALLNWCQRQVALHDVQIENLTSSWKNGLALSSILHRYRPDLIDITSLNPEDVAKNNQLAFDICEKELGIPPVMTGQEMADCEVPDKLSMVSYLAQIYETFRGEIPVVCQPKSSNDDRAISPYRQSSGTTRSILSRFSNKLQSKRKYSIEKESAKEKSDSMKRGRHPPFLHKRKSKERDKGLALGLLGDDIALTDFKSLSSSDTPKESINSRVKSLEMQMRKDAGLRCHLIEVAAGLKSPSTRAEHTDLNIKQIQEQLQRNGSGQSDKPRVPKVGRLRKDEWNVKMLEEKIAQQQKLLQKMPVTEKSKIEQAIFDSKLRLIEAKIQVGGSLTAEEKAKYSNFDSNLSKLQERLSKGNLATGERGHNQVAAMTEHMTTIWDKRANLKKDPLPPAPALSNTSQPDSASKVSPSEICYFCKNRIYVAQKLSTEGLFFHRTCFKCDYCAVSLKLCNYFFDKDAVSGGKFYCGQHFQMQKPDNRSQEMMRRKQAFLSHAVNEQEKEKMYATLLANTEKALSPNNQTGDVSSEPATANSPSPTEPDVPDGQKADAKTLNTLLEPLNIFGRDQTPERVEYENSILDYSEEELLTSELEEEELRQKNFGPIPDAPTSDDAYSDFSSSESESDEEAYAEELERSLTADETRKLAERWQRKYSAEHSLMDDEDSSSSSDDASDTEINSDEDGTSDDINSDEEYCPGNNAEGGTGKIDNQEVSKTPDVKGDLTVEVPVIDLKGMNQNLEDDTSTSESDISENISECDKDLESESTSEEDSESKPPVNVLPPKIPTIVIDESPPQDVDQDQDWPPEVIQATAVPAGSDKVEVVQGNQCSNNSLESSDPIILEPLGDDASEEVLNKMPNTVCDITTNDGTLENGGTDMILVSESHLETELSSTCDLVSDDSFGATIKSTEQCISKSSAVEQTSVKYDVNAIDKTHVSSLSSEPGEPASDGDNANIPSQHFHGVLDRNGKSDCAVFSDLKLVVGENNNTSLIECETKTLGIEPLQQLVTTYISSEEVNHKKANQDDSLSVDAVAEMSGTLSPDAKICDASPNLFKSDEALNEESPLPSQNCKHLSDMINISSDMSNPQMDISKGSSIDLSNVTIRKKNNKSCNESFNWDSDNSVSLPWFCEDSGSFDLGKPAALQQSLNEPITSYILCKEAPGSSMQSFESADSLSVNQVQNSPLEFFTPSSLNLISTPIQPMEKFQCISSLASNDLLSPISENESKSIVSEEKEFALSNPNTNGTAPGNATSNVNTFTSIVDSCDSKDQSIYYSDINSNLACQSDDQENDNSAYMTARNSSGKSKKYSGYSGSFAEKIRPKSALGDTIYLRSLNINLHKQQFPSLTKSNDKLDNISDDSNIRKNLFHGSDKSLSQLKQSTNDISDSYSKHFKRQTSVPSDRTEDNIIVPKTTSKMIATQIKKDSENVNHPVDKIRNLSLIAAPLLQDSYAEPISPYTYAQSRPVPENNFPIKMRPKCDMDLSKLREKREKRKSVHENIQGLPFADEEKASTPIDMPPSPGNVFHGSGPVEPSLLKNDDDQDTIFSGSKSLAQEKARKEARARARLKSDEELGLSPKNYRKKYQRQLSLSSIYYDELNSDEFFDHEHEELEHEMLNGSFRIKRVQIAEAQSIASDIDNISVKSAESVVSNHSVLTLEGTDIQKNDAANMAASTQSTETFQFSSPTTKSSTEASPEVLDPEEHPFESKDKSLKKEVAASVGSLADDDKLKMSNKKSFFSILNFSKNHLSKEKSAKTKGKETERASSLPADLCSKVPPKTKPFPNLKLKTKDKPKEKRRQKHLSTGTQEVMVIENTFVESPPKVIEECPKEPKSLLISSNQTKITPKYEVYRNPGIRLSAIPNHVPTHKLENGLAPKASEDSFSDTEDDTQRSNAQRKLSDGDFKGKMVSENDKEKKAQRVVQKVQRQQELKRLRTAQEIQRRLEELEVQQKELEQHGVELEKTLRAEGKRMQSGKESDLMHEWYKFMHSKNQLLREEQELLIRLKDLELEDRHSRLQQEITERMAQSTQKNPNQISEEKRILTEMLRIVDERDELVAMLQQLQLKEEEGEKSFEMTLLEQTKSIAQSSKS